ncbi:type I inositol 1,4,5-trisphosphate 5-phosphatase [Galendromus occidentalis]|uniref:inositol-polyphosphate 5-phosphatase n=1 Tax=Galendromus occidentalis TaxID=34638 RepID=A0AAJ7SEY9_9ACAR|nr:type I inositol 1,4,5-trisphosphate 5-phosphatase [Galendromus occidentalis]
MPTPYTEVTLVTANVGSIFERPEQILDIWIAAFVEGLVNDESHPAFLALHCQEVGGKTFGSAMDQVNLFTQKLFSGFKGLGYENFIAFVDPVLETSKFTALGSFYFVHKSVADQICIWNFKKAAFEPVPEYAFYAEEDLDLVPTVHKYKFTQDMTPMHRPSRKGFLRTRWQIHAQEPPIELVNVHLFHDESNFMAMQQFPSMYTESRRNALQFTLRRIGSDRDDNSEAETTKEPVAFFIFGDFNFRLDLGAVVSWLSEGTKLQETKSSSGEIIRQEFHEGASNALPVMGSSEPSGDGNEARNEPQKKVLTLEKKLFNIHEDTTRTFFICDLTRKKLLSHDKELEYFSQDLHEFDIEFPPSYPYSEERSEGASFGGTRCPAWCDRVLFNEQAEKLVSEKLGYHLIGRDVCMGDHKPVVLRVRIGKNGANGPGRLHEETLKTNGDHEERNRDRDEETVN